MKVRWIVVLNAANHLHIDDALYRIRCSVVSKSKRTIGVIRPRRLVNNQLRQFQLLQQPVTTHLCMFASWSSTVSFEYHHSWVRELQGCCPEQLEHRLPL